MTFVVDLALGETSGGGQGARAPRPRPRVVGHPGVELVVGEGGEEFTDETTEGFGSDVALSFLVVDSETKMKINIFNVYKKVEEMHRLCVTRQTTFFCNLENLDIFASFGKFNSILLYYLFSGWNEPV